MIAFEAARKIVLENSECPGISRVELSSAVNRVAAETVIAPFPLPQFDNSAMDGYAVFSTDTNDASPDHPLYLPVSGGIKAGDPLPELPLRPGTAVRIFTGAPLPAGADAVIMQEDTRREGDTILIHKAAVPGLHVRRKGEEIDSGQTVLQKGERLTPPAIGLLASLGIWEVPVFTPPHIGLVVTGSEVVSPGNPLQPGQIYDSNSYALRAALQFMGLPEPDVYYSPDKPEKLRSIIEKALEETDFVLSLGGISVGAYDLVKSAFEQCGVSTLFWRIAMKPGKPVYCGRKDKQLILGLPGNPVSALTTFYQLVRPALHKMTGLVWKPPELSEAVLASPLFKKPGRLEFVRAKLNLETDPPQVQPLDKQGSHMVSGLAEANCFIHFAAESEELPEGSRVKTEMINWGI
ncbi:MAG: gephyrin-like molybdotransferase Glp [Calditrichia bacterium]